MSDLSTNDDQQIETTMEQPVETHDTRTSDVPLEDALKLAEKLDQIAIIGAPSVIPRKDMANFLIQKLAKSIAYHPDARNTAYIQELVNNGYTRRNAQKIVWSARKLASRIDVHPVQPAPATPMTRAVSPGGEGVAGKEKGVVVTPAVSTPIYPPFVDNGPVTRLTDFTPLPLKEYARGSSLRLHHMEIFDGYEAFDYKREKSGGNTKGSYFASPDERRKYKFIWRAIGFDMVPEDLPLMLPALRKSHLLEFHKVDPDLVEELENERQKMITAGLDMDLPRTCKNS